MSRAAPSPVAASNPRINGNARAPWARAADWVVGLGAAGLLVVSLGGWFYYRAQLADIAADHLRLRVVGPARVLAGQDAQYTVTTTSVTGKPLVARIELTLYGQDGARLMGHDEKTDADGGLTVSIPKDRLVSDGARLEVLATCEAREARAAARLSVDPVRYVTRVTLDKPAYRPGETVRYRAVVLSRFDLTEPGDLPVEIEVLDPDTGVVEGSRRATTTRFGIVQGEFSLPEHLPCGRYGVRVRCPDGSFRDHTEPFALRDEGTPRWKTELELARPRYRPGDRVVADFSAQRAEGGPVGSARLTTVAEMGGEILHESEATTSPLGTYQVAFDLPRKIGPGKGRLRITLEEGGVRQTIGRPIFIGLGEIDVRFSPEGGALVGGLPNRVYFAARDARGEPVDIRGTIIDSQGRPVAGIATTQRGMGTFTIVPERGEAYSLRLQDEADGLAAARLPPVTPEADLVVNAGLGVFQAGQRLDLTVRASKEGLPLVASASCRGVAVGRQAFVVDEVDTAYPVAIPLEDHVSGIIEVTIYDYRFHPPRPVARRLVYRQPARRLQARMRQLDEPYRPGNPVVVGCSVVDEDEDPIEATLGVCAREDRLGVSKASSGASLAADLLLGSGLPALPGAFDFFPPDSREHAVALDLFLGNQPALAADGATPRPTPETNDDFEFSPDPASAFPVIDAGPPAVFDNLLDLQERYQEGLAAYQAHRTWATNVLTGLSLFGGIGLVMLVAMLETLNVARGPRLWVPAIGVGTVCLVVGGILMDPERFESLPESPVAFLPYQPDDAPQRPPGGVRAKGDAPDDETGADDPVTPADVLLWCPLVRVDREGTLSDGAGRPVALGFDLPKTPGTFRLLVDAHAKDGRIGSAESVVVSRMPFHLKPELASRVVAGDRIELPTTVVNASDQRRAVRLLLRHGNLVQLEGAAERTIEIGPRDRVRAIFALDVSGRKGQCPLTFRAASEGLTDEMTRRLEVVPPGFPHRLVRGGQLKGEQKLVVRLPEQWEPGSLEVTLEAFPSLLADLQKGLESIVDRPYECLERTVGANLVGAICRKHMDTHHLANPALTRRVRDLIAEGYPKTTQYEAPEHGYGRFAGEPAEAVLSAFALLQLDRLAEAWDVDPEAIDRAGDWLVGLRDGEGRFRKGAGDSENEFVDDVDAAFITWALSESGRQDLDVDRLVQRADASQNPYLLAVAAAVAVNAGKVSQGAKLLDTLAVLQAVEGRLALGDPAPPHRADDCRAVETTALAALAWMKLPGYAEQVERAVDALLAARRADGGFGSIRATVLALDALVEHARLNRRTLADGKLLVKKDPKTIGQAEFKAGCQDRIALTGLESELESGDNDLVLALSGSNAMPFVVDVAYHGAQAPDDEAAPLRLATRLDRAQVAAGKTLALSVTVENVTEHHPLPVVAVVRLPAGLEIPRGQLEKLQKAGHVDHFDLGAGQLVCYWRRLPPQGKTDLQLDLRGAIPGRFTSLPSYVFACDAPERRSWASPLKVAVVRD